MNCWNCGYPIEENTKVCRRCEADQTGHEPVDLEVLNEVAEMAEKVAPGIIGALHEVAKKHDTAEGFADAIFVGPCPECGSKNVGDCDSDPDYNNILLGRCFACGNVWCTECGYKLKKGEKRCPDEEKHYPDPPDDEDLL